ncbi:ABC-2 type transport system permease protein [Amycolatopsis lexingtonensis]|uniref:ABC-2 type transport system permease protein n=1 Tax=Amycolatopsis lexingtonensis TaxID=218822 RepID=A0ABR9IBX6_9PSEU|nr:ABC transporter permease [Amycolatopsis lexingtonensis]MBE1500654.1 ABC-2 type transport system permease protein [Amycolatopsis lexingtonensis]
MKKLSGRRAVWLVLKRELNTRLRTRSFVIGTAVLLVLLLGYVGFQTALAGSSDQSKVGLTGQATGIAKQLQIAAAQSGRHVETVTVTDPAEGRKKVEDGDLDALVSGSAAKLTATYKSALDDQLRRVLDQVAQQQVLDGVLSSAQLEPAEVMAQVNSTHVQDDALSPEPADHTQRLVLGLIVAFLLYMSIITYGMMVAQGVVEEKSSRVVELLLASVRPWQLLLGKVIGIGLVGLTQLVILGAAGLLAATATGVFTLSGFATGAVLWGLLWYLLGFLLYAMIYGALGSLVSRQEDTQSVVGPLNIILIVGFVAGFNLLLQDPSGTAAKVVSLIPLLSPILMPARISTGAAAGWEIVLSLALTLASVALLTWLGGKIYGNSVLRIGSRIKLSEALRG